MQRRDGLSLGGRNEVSRTGPRQFLRARRKPLKANKNCLAGQGNTSVSPPRAPIQLRHPSAIDGSASAPPERPGTEPQLESQLSSQSETQPQLPDVSVTIGAAGTRESRSGVRITQSFYAVRSREVRWHTSSGKGWTPADLAIIDHMRAEGVPAVKRTYKSI